MPLSRPSQPLSPQAQSSPLNPWTIHWQVPRLASNRADAEDIRLHMQQRFLERMERLGGRVSPGTPSHRSTPELSTSILLGQEDSDNSDLGRVQPGAALEDHTLPSMMRAEGSHQDIGDVQVLGKLRS